MLSLSPLPTQRAQLFEQLQRHEVYDLVVIGGGATGLGVALDAALRGLRVVLLEADDFAAGTSSKATKLVHGGVRYLAQGNVSLVREALHERATFLRIAPHIAQPLAFVMPSYKCWETPFYGVGLKAYDVLAGKDGIGHTQLLSRSQTLRALPGVNSQSLKGGVQYWDGQFDDARMAIALARTAAKHGALVINHCKVDSLLYNQQKVAGVECTDSLTQQSYRVRAKCVINATGVWVDSVRQLDTVAEPSQQQPIVSPSQGVHLVVDRSFLSAEHALLIPKTQDDRVLFAVPWLGSVILGTTDTPTDTVSYNPLPFEEEITFILSEASKYLAKAPKREDVKSVWVGLRPLIRPNKQVSSKSISRQHEIIISNTQLVTVTGGKWTTYRSMAEAVLGQCQMQGLLPRLAPSSTATCKLVGAENLPLKYSHAITALPGVSMYGDEAPLLAQLPGADNVLAPSLTEAMVRFAARYEYAITVTDVLARRSRLLFLDAQQAIDIAESIASLLHEETAADPQLEAFYATAQRYLLETDAK